MKLKILTTFFMMLLVNNVIAQQKKHNPKDQVSSLNWDIIGSIRYTLNDKNQLIANFSESMERFKNKTFELEGYLIPIKNKRMHDRCLLSPLPINQCFYCGSNGVPAMILIEMKKPIPYSEKTIHISGILKLAEGDNNVPVSLIQAETFEK
ncbi:hypothetical protein ACFOWA_19495 [Pedobacter lithocola]|uniref:DUF3299 domain-containing protein n=1 Tax=Pedobacter lithocola TaxID=1908239 RepID=A0ABV8PGM5_9SPHI